MPFTKILCPTDFSSGARHALDLAIRLAKRDRAELVIVHSWELPVYSGGYIVASEVIQAIAEDGRRFLAGNVRLATEAGVASVTSRYVTGTPWRAIVDILTEEHAFDLCVIGTHGNTGLRRVLLGSIAEKVVRLAPCAVLAVHPEDAIDRFTHVLCPTDFSEAANYALDLATRVTDSPEAAISLTHVVEIPRTAERGPQVLAMTRDLEKQSDDELDRRIKHLTTAARIRARTEIGHPSAALIGLLDKEHFDLVVVGSHGRTGLRRVVLGSLAEKLVRHAPCPVLVARRRHV